MNFIFNKNVDQSNQSLPNRNLTPAIIIDPDTAALVPLYWYGCRNSARSKRKIGFLHKEWTEIGLFNQ